MFQNDAGGGVEWVPGGFIWSASNMGDTTPDAPSMAGTVGTSQATPHVAGVVALLQSVAPTPMTPAEVTNVLTATARMFPGAIDQPLGSGILDAGAAVEAARLGYIPPPPAHRVVNGALVSHIYATSAQARDYVVNVPAGATRLTLQAFGGAGDADMYVRFGQRATPSENDARSVRPGNNSAVVLQAPAPGDYYVSLLGAAAFTGLHFKATIQ
jgi:serine protease